MKNLVKWMVGISFVIAGLSKLAEGSILGVLFISVGLFVIPRFLAYVERESNFQLPRAGKYMIVVFTFLMMVGTSERTKPVSSADTTIKASTNDSVKDDVEYVPSPPPAPREYTIVADPETFRQRFNAFVTEVENGSLKIKKLTILDGKVNNVFSHMVTDHISIVGQLNKSDNSIRGLMVTLQGDGTLQSGVNVITTIMGVIDSTNPGLSPEERGEVLKKLGLFRDGVDLNKIDSRTTKNGISYSLRGSEMIGLMLAVESEDEID